MCIKQSKTRRHQLISHGAVTLIEDMDSSKRQVHVNKKDPTRSITYRLSEKLVSELETEANQKGISQNVLVKQILEKIHSMGQIFTKNWIDSSPNRNFTITWR